MSANETHASSPEDIAIVGMNCVFAGAANLQAFWENIVGKKDVITDPPEDWDAHLYDPNSSANDRIYTKKGGFLGELCAFEPFRLGIVPTTVDGGEPDQFLALEIAHRALADANFAGHPVPSDRVEIVLGRGITINRGISNLVQRGLVVDRVLEILRTLHPEHTEDELRLIKQELKKSLPPFNGEMAASLIPSLATGRIANRLNFQGANYLIDAACASSLIAAQKGVEDLRARRCDVAVVGGCQATTTALNFLVMSQLSALSRRGEIRPFDKDADGTLLGEGVGILVLKRLSDAETADDRIYAIIKAIGVASDGRATGILAPRLEGEVLALNRAYAESGIDPRTIGLVEAHGTATPLGDATEVQTLKAIFGERTGPIATRALGSVKSMIGHCLPAAGSAGLIKTAMALYTKVLPPTLHCEHPNPALGLDSTSFYINTETRPWIHGARYPRRAGVNAFGFGGINAHAILEEYQPRDGRAPVTPLRRPSEIVIVEAASRDTLVARANEIAKRIVDGADRPLADHARALNTALADGACRIAVVATSHEDAAKKLADAANRMADLERATLRDRRGLYGTVERKGRSPRIAFMFPGEGSQYVNMLRDLCIFFPEVRAWFDRIDRVFTGHPRNLLPSQVVFPPPQPDAPEARVDMASLWQMDVGPETVFAASQAILSLLRRIKLTPDAVVGHSTGEYSALIASGAYQVDDDKLVEDSLALNRHYEQSRESGRLAKGWLIAVAGAKPTALAALVAERDDVYLAMDNCPNQQVVCALSEASAEWLEAKFQAMNALTARLPFERAYHTPAFWGFCEGLDEYFDRLNVRLPERALYSCVTAAPVPTDLAEIKRLSITQWVSRVRFRETIERMYADGISIFVECAPRNNLCAFVDDILRGKKHLACPVDVEHRDGITQFNHLIGQLAIEGVKFDLAGIYETTTEKDEHARNERRPLMKLKSGLQSIRLDPNAIARLADRTTPVSEPVQASAKDESKPVRNGELRPAPLPAASEPIIGAPPGPRLGAPTLTESDAVLAAYFATMETFVRHQKEMMEIFLRSDGGKASEAFGPSQQISAAPSSEPFPATVAARLAANPERYPMLHGASIVQDGDAMILRVAWNVRDQIYLLDHTMGRQISERDPTLTALPVVPLTFSMEALAEAAALVGQKPVVGIRELRAYRWIALDDGTIELELVVSQVPNAPLDNFHVLLRSTAANGTRLGAQPAFVEATVILGKLPLPPPVAAPERYQQVRRSRWRPEDIYNELMFHGPRLQALTAMNFWAQDGTEGTLIGMPFDRLFSWSAIPQFFIDPITTDAMGQLAAMWIADESGEGRDFPFRLEQFEVLGPCLAPGEITTCRARTELQGNDQVRSNIDIVDAQGRLRFRMSGWWDKRFEVPARFHNMRCHPAKGLLSHPIEVCDLGTDASLACVMLDDVSLDFLEPSGEFWLRALSQLTLSRNERDYFRAMSAALPRRAEWLLGRIAAKDAIRTLLRWRGIEAIYPADIEIAAEDSGRPVIAGPWPAEWGEIPYISIAHTPGRAIALTGSPTCCAGVGVDIEPIKVRPQSFLETAFTEREQLMLSNIDDAHRPHFATGIWCAKEAAGKALGRGLDEILATLEVDHWDPDGQIRMAARASKTSTAAGQVQVMTLHHNGFMIALAAIPHTL